MEPFLGKKYKLKTSENFEDFLKYIGVGLMSRKLAISVSPVSVLVKNDDGSYNLTLITPIRKVSVTFRLGEEYEDERPDGVKVTSVVTMEGNKLIQIQKEENGRQSKHVREFTENKLTVTSTAEGWDGVCVRVYELEK